MVNDMMKDKLTYNVDEKELLIKDEVTERLKPMMIECAKGIIETQKTRENMFIRYHCDADGISSGLAMNEVLRSTRPLSRQNSSVRYTLADAFSDINKIDSYKPLMIILDFGSGPDSNDGYQILKSAGFKIMIIDHHPYDTRPDVDFYLSPWVLKDDVKERDLSKYTAGYLTVEVARMLGLDDAYARKLISISLSGDKSPLNFEKDDNTALVFDYMAKYSMFPNKLNFYAHVLSDDRLRQSIFMQANDKINNILQKGINVIKVAEYDLADSRGNPKSDKLILGIINIDKVVVKYEFPSKAKSVGVMFDYLNDKYPGQPVVMIGYGANIITFRINSSAFNLGYSGKNFIKEIKAEFPDMVLSGGGHDKAASVRLVEPEYTEVIMSWLKERISSAKK